MVVNSAPRVRECRSDGISTASGESHIAAFAAILLQTNIIAILLGAALVRIALQAAQYHSLYVALWRIFLTASL